MANYEIIGLHILLWYSSEVTDPIKGFASLVEHENPCYGDMFPFYGRLLGCIHDIIPVISPLMDTYWYSGAPPPGHQSFQVCRSALKNC